MAWALALVIAGAAACYDLTPVPASDAGTGEDAGACGAEDAAVDGCTGLAGGGSRDAGDASIADGGAS